MNRFLPIIMLFLLASPVHAEWTQQDSGTTANLVDVCFVDELHGWAIGNYGSPVIIATKDGGVTWQQQECPSETSGLERVCFITEDVGFIAGRNRIISTDNKGETWDVSYTAPTYYKFNDMTFIDENTGWVAGTVYGNPDNDDLYGGVVLLTKDGGETWTEKLYVTNDDPYIYAFDAIAFANEQLGWMTGSNKFHAADGFPIKVYRTQDGGENWELLSVLDDFGANRLYAVNTDTLWASFHPVRLSVDGGMTWSTMPYDSVDISLVDGASGWAVTTDSAADDVFKIRSFSDAGVSWSEHYEQGTIVLYAVDSYGVDFACAVGVGGTILTYNDNSSSVDAPSKPELFTLEPNYPNPFNASTTIAYTLTEDSPVTISLFTATGQRVRTLCDRSMPAGRHSIVVDGSDLASGLYVARIEAQGAMKYTRMLLLK